MSDETRDNPATEPSLTAKVELDPARGPDSVKGVLLPGMIGIALYMLVLAAVITFGVISGHIPKIFLILAPFFITASFGMLRLFRWAWALTMAAVFLLMTYNLWLFFMHREAAGAVQGVLNMVFFLYLVREDVRARLR